MTADFSTTYDAKRKRIARLPKLIRETAETQSLKDAMGIVTAYQDGLRKNNFKLASLHPFSVQRKVEAGYDRPKAPLYGAGDSLERTLYNGLIIVKGKGKWFVRFSNKKHHTSDLTLNQLHLIHENGAVIKVTDKMRKFLHYIGLHLKASTKIIRIPPRPVMRKALNRHLRKRKREENTREVKRAIQALINRNDESIFRKLNDYTEREKELLNSIT